MTEIEKTVAAALQACEKEVNGVRAAFDAIRANLEGGDLDGALGDLHTQLYKRLHDAWNHASAAAVELEDLGAVYPPRR